MKALRFWFPILCLGGLLVFTIILWLHVYGEADGKLTVAFLDVGQGESVLIEGPTGTQVLIDGGLDRTVLKRLSEVMPWYDRMLDVVIGTHPDQDHIGGLSYVLERYRVAHIFQSGVPHETSANDAFLRSVEKEGAAVYESRRNTIIDLGGGAYVRFLFPDRDLGAVETNTASAVVQVVYGDIEFLLTGDAPQAIERYLVSLEGEGLKSKVLKLGHHGSKTSSAEAFVEAVHPNYAIVSAGKDNSYGHPHKEVVDRLHALNIPTLVTSEAGTITFVTDGRTLTVR
jgi:competence protein ComEC